jgi:hypothetical protein
MVLGALSERTKKLHSGLAIREFFRLPSACPALEQLPRDLIYKGFC